MELKALEGKNKKELSMIEVAHAILAQRGDVMSFADLANEIQKYLGDSDEEIRKRLVQFYTDLNVDGSFISLGDNLWGLRTWYPYDSIDEATVHPEDEDEERPKKKRRKVNAFLADADDDDDVIDYDDDDPEDQDDFDDDDDDDATGSNSAEDSHDLDDIDEENPIDDEDHNDVPNDFGDLHETDSETDSDATKK